MLRFGLFVSAHAARGQDVYVALMPYFPTGLASSALVEYVAVILSPFTRPVSEPVNGGLAVPYLRC
jgi:hypothetical protein